MPGLKELTEIAKSVLNGCEEGNMSVKYMLENQRARSYDICHARRSFPCHLSRLITLHHECCAGPSADSHDSYYPRYAYIYCTDRCCHLSCLLHCATLR